MALPFTNIHAHVFNSSCAPDRFLRILPVPLVRKAPGVIKGIIDSKPGRWVIHRIFHARYYNHPNKRSEIDKYIAFLNVGTQVTQLDVFRTTLQTGSTFDPSVRIVGLTMNMDYMDSQPSKNQVSFATQLEEVKAIKRYYPVNFFPFLGIDPRHLGGEPLVNWARPYFESGVVTRQGRVYPYFSGIKLYPALGFFPFDTRLEALYQFAEHNQLPIITHCTRVGSQYIGAQIESLIPDQPSMIDIPGNPAISAARTNIEKRISDYKHPDRQWIKNSKIGKNDLACDVFGHPENYIPLLERFPNLRICLAHMGGSNEIIKSEEGELKEIRQVDPHSWFEHIEAMMKKYPNLYTDISYTLSDFTDANGAVFKRTIEFLNTPDHAGKLLGERVLFGTDFFMTEQERPEAELYALTKKNLGTWWDVIGRVNTQRFLMQPL